MYQKGLLALSFFCILGLSACGKKTTLDKPTHDQGLTELDGASSLDPLPHSVLSSPAGGKS